MMLLPCCVGELGNMQPQKESQCKGLQALAVEHIGFFGRTTLFPMTPPFGLSHALSISHKMPCKVSHHSSFPAVPTFKTFSFSHQVFFIIISESFQICKHIPMPSIRSNVSQHRETFWVPLFLLVISCLCQVRVQLLFQVWIYSQVLGLKTSIPLYWA